ncbi:MAG: hypothetical protein AAFR96_09045 [Planctomycetota bacterium]
MFHAATKLTVVTEQFVASDVCRIIEDCGGRGYTMVSAGGKGSHGVHPTQARATVADGFENVMVETVASDREPIDRIARRIMDECLSDKPGMFYLQDVEVCRFERF